MSADLISVIIPIGTRQAPLRELYSEYRRGLEATGHAFEFVFVIDGRHTNATRDLKELVLEQPDICVVHLASSFGEATALMAGAAQSRGGIIVTLPAYRQIVADDIPKLVAGLAATDLVIGRRWPRAGGAFERMRRSAFHGLLDMVTSQRFSDLGCNARAMRREVLEATAPYGDQHRFLAALASRQGFTSQEVDVRQSPQDRFEGSYSPFEYLRRALDILTIFFLVRFTKKPLRFFGTVGAIVFAIGVVLILWLATDRLVFDKALADRPALLLASLMVVMGIQVFAVGLLGELMIFTHARELKEYQIDRVVQFSSTPVENPSPSNTDAPI